MALEEKLLLEREEYEAIPVKQSDEEHEDDKKK